MNYNGACITNVLDGLFFPISSVFVGLVDISNSTRISMLN